MYDGAISRNKQLNKRKGEAREIRVVGEAKKKKDWDEKFDALNKYRVCMVESAPCVCGEVPCITKRLRYCESCDRRGNATKHYPLKKSKCGKKACLAEAGGVKEENPPDAPAGPAAPPGD